MALLIHNKNFRQENFPLEINSIVEFIIKHSSFENFHLIVPTGKLSRKIKKELIKEYFIKTGKPLSEPNVYTLNKFADMIFKNISVAGSYRKISDAFARVLFEEADMMSELKFFKRSGKKLNSTILNKLANIIFGLKEDGISTLNMITDFDKINNGEATDVNDPNKYFDIYELYSNYEKKLEGKFIDSVSLINNLNLALKKEEYFSKFKSLFKKEDYCLVYGFSEFKSPEIQFLSNFANVDFPLAINFDFSAINGPLFGNLKETIEQFVMTGFEKTDLDELYNQAPIDVNFDVKDPNISASKFLRRWLFNVEKEIRHQQFSDIIKILEAENIEDETDSIIKLIKYFCSDEKIIPGDICIVSRKPELYSELFREKFKSESIPVNVTDRFDLSKSPVVIAIFSVLDLINRGFNREDLNRLVTNPFISIFNEGENRMIDGVNLYNTAIKLKIFGGHSRGGHKGWLTRIQNRINSNLNRIEYAEKNIDTNELDIIILKKENQLLNIALSDFNALLTGIDTIKRELTLSEFTSIIKDSIIKKFKIKENIHSYYKKIHTFSDKLNENEYNNLIEIVEKDSNALWSFVQHFDEFISIYNERFSSSFSLLELTKRLKTSVEAAKYQIKEKVNYGVTVTSIEQIRGIEFKVLILCGCLDGNFPVAYKPDNFLGKHLPDSEERHLKSEQMLFYQFLTNSSNLLDNSEIKIFISYPLYDEDRDLVRSPFIDSLLKISNLEEKNKIYNLKSLKKHDLNNSIHSEQISEIPWLSKIILNNEKQIFESNVILNKFNDDGKIYLNNLLNNYLKYICNTNFNHGIIEFDENDLILKNYLNSYCNKTFSITEFEKFKSCPFSHFVERILRLKSIDSVDTSLSPLEIGNFYHNVSYLFYTELQKDGVDKDIYIDVINSNNDKFPSINSVRLKEVHKERYMNLLFNLAKEELERIRFDHPFFEFEETEIFGRNNQKGILEKWLDLEIERYENNWDTAPGLFEFAFGHLSNEPVLLNDNIKIRGKIDRIEFENANDYFRIKIADYKTNLKNTKSDADIIMLKSFQMPIYIYVAEKLLNKYYQLETEAIGGIYYGWKGYTENSFKYVLVDNDTETSLISKKEKLKKETRNEIIENVINETQNIINSIIEGRFLIDAKPLICKYCEYSSICKKNEKK